MPTLRNRATPVVDFAGRKRELFVPIGDTGREIFAKVVERFALVRVFGNEGV
jgi:hypothetical protein